MEVGGAYLVLMLYAFLEKSLKKVQEWFVQEEIVPARKAGREPKLYSYLYTILAMERKEFYERYGVIAEVLDASRRIRNQFAHENLEGNIPEDFTEDGKKLSLINLIDTISQVLRLAERAYKDRKG